MYFEHDLKRTIKECFGKIEVYDFPDLNLHRLGSINDGGYVVHLPDQPVDLVTMGVGNNVEFERDYFYKNNKPKVYLFDPYVHDDEIRAGFPYSMFRHISAQQVPLSMFQGRDAILKMDIEGDEWQFFAEIPVERLTYFSQIICEFHFLTMSVKEGLSPYFTDLYQSFCNQQNRYVFWKRSLILHKLFDYFIPYHIHANNSLPLETLDGISFPPLIEISMIRRDLGKVRKKSKAIFPIPGFDSPNKTDRPDIEGWWPICS